MRRRLAVQIGIAVLALACAAPPGLAEEAAPLTLEDVVRRFVSGSKSSEIVQWIRGNNVDFDLNDEMIEELGLAGIPPEVIRAMRERQLELHPPPEPQATAETTEEDDSIPTLTLRLNPVADATEKRAAAHLLNAVPPPMAERLRLKQPDSHITELAVYLLCTTPDHVPDHWRSQTPLGRDFVSVPRHKLLAFHPGASAGDETENATSDGQPVRLSKLTLELPETLEVELEPSVEHDLVLGLAVQIEERYYSWAGDDWLGVVLDANRTIVGWVKSGGDPALPAVEVHFDRGDGEPEGGKP